MYSTVLLTSSLQQYLNGSQVRGEIRWEGAAIFLGVAAAIFGPIYLYGLIKDRLRK